MARAIFAVVAVVLLGGAAARANFIAVFTSNSDNVYNYSLRFSADQQGEVLRAGDTVTLYDLSVPADITSVVGPVGFTVTQQLLGITPADLVGAPGISDSNTLLNITFTYTGADRTVSTNFTSTVVTMASNYKQFVLGKESGSTHIDFALDPPVPTQTDTSIRSVLLPAITGSTPNTPEPGSLAVMGLGMAVMVVRRRRAGSSGVTSLI